MLETIKHNDQILALVVRGSFKKEGLEFFTPNSFSQQLAYMNHQKGHKIQPHIHKQVIRQVDYTQEVLIVKSGRVRVDLYKNDKTFHASVTLGVNDIILLVSGGHGFEMLEPTEMIEVKQGPYINPDEDKKKF